MKINKLKRLTSILHISLLPGLVACSNTLVLDQVTKAEENVYNVNNVEDPNQYYSVNFPIPVDIIYSNGVTKYFTIGGSIELNIRIDNQSYLTCTGLSTEGFDIGYRNGLNGFLFKSSGVGTNTSFVDPVPLYDITDSEVITFTASCELQNFRYINDVVNASVGVYFDGFLFASLPITISNYINQNPNVDLIDWDVSNSSFNLDAFYNFIYQSMLAAKNYYKGYQDALDDVESNPSKYGLNTDEEMQSEYNRGFQDGQSANFENNGFMMLMQSIFSAPVSMFRDAFNFEIFGINVANLVALLLTIGLVILVVSIFKGKNGG